MHCAYVALAVLATVFYTEFYILRALLTKNESVIHSRSLTICLIVKSIYSRKILSISYRHLSALYHFEFEGKKSPFIILKMSHALFKSCVSLCMNDCSRINRPARSGYESSQRK